MLAQSRLPQQRAVALVTLGHAVAYNSEAKEEQAADAKSEALASQAILPRGRAAVGAKLHWAAMRADLTFMKVTLSLACNLALRVTTTTLA